ncbi:MAG: glycosyltransferase family 2 protein [Chloroflexi bacterium HGW-Chloroflexi-10]|nr:MAG: glycosyltransferase family 2 protein [Chloroflexi bacterium HGW-Chloroflexi-10]
MNADVSLIIVSYNVCNFLLNCLDSVFKQSTALKIEVWVVDNASTDGSMQIVKEKFPQVNQIVNEKNIGFAAANNQAIRLATGKYIWLLNPDTIVEPFAMQNLVTALQEEPQAGVAGSRLVNPDGSLQSSCYPFPTLFRETWRMLLLDHFLPVANYAMHTWDINKTRSVDNLQGASLMVPKFVLDQVGLLDESFFMYTEEVDLNYRIQKAGMKNLWVPNSEVTHFGGQSTRQSQTAMFLQLYQTKIHFFRKHYGNQQAERYKQLLAITAWIRVKFSSIQIKINKASSEKSHYLINNYQHLLNALPGF